MALLDGLVSYWPLDGNSQDAHGTNHGTDTAITYAAGKLGDAASGNWINVGSANLNLLEMSAQFWIKPAGAGYVIMLCRVVGDGIGTNDNTYLVYLTGLQVWVIASGGGLSAAPLTNAVYSHVVVTRSATGATKIYVNGVQAAANTITAPDSLPATATLIGTRADGFGTIGAAQLDEVAIWNRVLTADEVGELYNGSIGLTYSEINPVAAPFGPEQYATQLMDLLPRGRLWNREADSKIRAVQLAIGEELARVDARGLDLLNESDPRTADETIAEWESMLSLPDERVTAIPATLAERRIAVTQKYVNTGGQSVAYFTRLALACGYVITIEKFANSVLRIGDRIGDRFYGAAYAYAMQVNVAVPVGTVLPVADFERVIRAACHSHIEVIFVYLP